MPFERLPRGQEVAPVALGTWVINQHLILLQYNNMASLLVTVADKLWLLGHELHVLKPSLVWKMT